MIVDLISFKLKSTIILHLNKELYSASLVFALYKASLDDRTFKKAGWLREQPFNNQNTQPALAPALHFPLCTQL